MPPTPPASASSLPKPADQPGQRPVNTSAQAPPRPTDDAARRQNASFLARQTPGNGSPSLTPGTTSLGDSAGARPAGTNSAASLSGSGLRPSYSPFGSREPSTDSRDTAKTIVDPRGVTRRVEASSAAPNSASPTVPHAHTGGPHHHHHHHHHHPHSTTASGSTTTATPAAAPAASTTSTPATSTTTKLPQYNYAYRGVFPPSMMTEQELRDRERHRLRERERQETQRREQARREQEKKDAKPPIGNPTTSPRVTTATPANPYPRPSLPPSPTTARTLPSAASASPVISNKPSPALPQTAGATGSSQRPNLPLPSISSIGSRSLPSPFDAQGRERPPSATGQQAASGVHRRTPSGGTGSRPDAAALGPPASPGKPPGAQPTGSRAVFGTSAFGVGRDLKTTPNPAQPSLPATREAPRPAHAAPTSNPAATSSSSRPPGREFPGGQYPGLGGFMPFTGGLGYDSFGGWGGNRAGLSRQEAEEKERRAHAALEQDAQVARIRAATAQREKEVREAREAREQQEKERIRREHREREISLQRIKEAGQRQEQLNRDQFQRYLDSQASQVPPQNDALQQVAPRREPRPYEYKTDPRDYQYTPRDKRPRMDAAVDDARRGNANKTKRRKDEDKQKSPVRIRDFSALTETTRKYPEVKSTAVEAWLKHRGELNRVVAEETYTGSKYRMSQHRLRNTRGGIVKVRIGGGFLGKNWKLRGAPGWEDASSTPLRAGGAGLGKGDGQISAGWDTRGVWGTDVYTDDSDLGLVLVHAGWIKWGGGQQTEDGDSLIVDVRIVPPLIRYTATERCGVLTRNWGNGHDGSSIVIEAVSRVPSTKALLAGKKNRKKAIAEYLRQRDLVFDLDQQPLRLLVPHAPMPEMEDEIWRIYDTSAVVEPFTITTTGGFMIEYDSTMLSEETELVYRPSPSDPDSEENASHETSPTGGHGGSTKTLLNHDIELIYKSHRYRLTVNSNSARDPRLSLWHYKTQVTQIALETEEVSGEDMTVVFDSLHPRNVHWIEQGLLFVPEAERAKAGETKANLVKIEGWRWKVPLPTDP